MQTFSKSVQAYLQMHLHTCIYIHVHICLPISKALSYECVHSYTIMYTYAPLHTHLHKLCTHVIKEATKNTNVHQYTHANIKCNTDRTIFFFILQSRYVLQLYSTILLRPSLNSPSCNYNCKRILLCIYSLIWDSFIKLYEFKILLSKKTIHCCIKNSVYS